MENTAENKAKFFAQYLTLNIEVGGIFRPMIGIYTHPFNHYGVADINENRMWYDNAILPLKPLSSITDDDALECIGSETFNLYQNDENNGVYGMSASGMFIDDISFYVYETTNADFLRSKGYALPWMGLSVEKQIEYGWIKLKSE